MRLQAEVLVFRGPIAESRHRVQCAWVNAGGELKAGSDVGEVMWIEKKRIPQIQGELHDDTRRLLQMAGIVE